MMKKKLLLASLLLPGLFLMFSCNKELEAPGPPESPPEDLSFIQSMGFDVSDVVDKGDYYLVEGDIRLLKDSLSGYLPAATRQYYGGSSAVITQWRVNNIRIWIDPAMPTTPAQDWRPAIRQAAAAWSDIYRCYVKMTVTELESLADIKVTLHEAAAGIIGEADLPLNGRPGQRIIINPLGQWTESQKIYGMAHQLGHCLGLKHTNHTLLTPDQGTHIRIPGTPDVNQGDERSVMNKLGVKDWQGLSTYDRVAARYLYPAPIPIISPSDPLIYINTPIAFHDLSQVGYGNYNAMDVFPGMCRIPDYPYSYEEDMCVVGSGRFALEYTFTNYNLFDVRFDLSKFSFYWGECGSSGGKPEITGIYTYNNGQTVSATAENTILGDDGGSTSLIFTFDNIFRDQYGNLAYLWQGDICGRYEDFKLMYDGRTLYRFVHPELFYDVDDLGSTIFYTDDIHIRYLYNPRYEGYYYRESTNKYAYKYNDLFRN